MARRLFPLLMLSLFITPAFAQRLPPEKQKSGEDFRAAFAEVIESALSWTVNISVEGKPVALGAIVDPEGYVLTKASLLGSEVVCRLSDGSERNAAVIGIDREYDLAMLKIEGNNLPTIEWAAENAVPIGRWLVTPGLQAVPVAVGVMSAPARLIPKNKGLIGVSVTKVDDGIRVDRVQPKSGADLGGIRKGDVLREVDGDSVKTVAELSSRLSKRSAGDTVVIRFRRGLQEVDATVTLKEPTGNRMTRGAFQNRMGGELSTRRAGFPSVIQHDSVLKPEHCGGPLLDLNGKAVGINIARAGRTESYAVSYDKIRPLLDLLKNGKRTPLSPSRFWMSSPPPPPLPEN